MTLNTNRGWLNELLIIFLKKTRKLSFKNLINASNLSVFHLKMIKNDKNDKILPKIEQIKQMKYFSLR